LGLGFWGWGGAAPPAPPPRGGGPPPRGAPPRGVGGVAWIAADVEAAWSGVTWPTVKFTRG
jgi:hypothetical protein